jgi:hypothetical protein
MPPMQASGVGLTPTERAQSNTVTRLRVDPLNVIAYRHERPSRHDRMFVSSRSGAVSLVLGFLGGRLRA